MDTQSVLHTVLYPTGIHDNKVDLMTRFHVECQSTLRLY